MKKILIILAVIFFIFISIAAVFVLTFDANKYKGVIAEKISRAIHEDVALDAISFDFTHGLGCRIDGLALKEKDKGWNDAWLKSRKAHISIKVPPLFKKAVQINRIEIEGLDLKLTDQLLKQPVQLTGPYEKKVDRGTLGLGALKFLARSIVVKDSTVEYTQAKTGKTIKAGISTLMLNNVSFSGPVRVSAVVSMLDKAKDSIVVKCIVFPELSTKAPYLKDLDLKLDTDEVDLPGLLAALGYTEAAAQLIDKEMHGIVMIKAERLYIYPKRILDSTIKISLHRFSVKIPALPAVIEDIEFDAVLEQGNLTVHKFTGSAAGGSFSIQGSVKDIFSSQLLKFDVSCNTINLGSLVPRDGPELHSFQGTADFKAIVTGQGLRENQLIRSLTGSGSLKIDKPVLKNMNILRTALDKMDMMPGLVTELRENLPEDYTGVIKQDDTNFRPIDITYSISQGKLFFKETDVESDGFLVKARGSISLLGDTAIDSHLFIASDLSHVFLDIVKELRFLANEQGMINMPLVIAGRVPQISVNIDRDYVLRRLIVSKGSELIEGIFKKKDPENSNMQQEEGGSPDPVELIKSIFDNIK